MMTATTNARPVPIDRRSRVSPATFEADYLSGAGTPVIVTDAIDGWQAKTTWTFEFFGSRYGSQTILVEADTPGGRVYRVNAVFRG